MTTTLPELETPRLYIANTPNLKPIGVRAAVSDPLVQYTCLHCGENLSLITDDETYWFEHSDKSSEKRCIHCLSFINQQIRNEMQEGIYRWLKPLVPITDWFCVLCQNEYSGSKYCPTCQDGIYSIAALSKD
ncbi:putative zinc ribbon protein [Proteus mirabilis]|uniref:putative zinc ribbon protein n=1 Tax=Morganellaceae TaxID=1903414 RepID=UPI00101B8DA5|nr:MULTISPECIES: putative zinc ribbon protein [Morganellaceae]MCL0013101.1 zinc-ribbon domain-containing protein [Providencia rettgeri]MTC50071.1 hypothetical protein [Providencia alcalifaciens]RYI08839.1 hypothetical protein EVX97_10045 [Proteus mirabilis]HCR4061464.1 hypothetical protein [Proteus mirabilis]HCT6318781.1 hypothetical protein [Proteus mirabilis]